MRAVFVTLDSQLTRARNVLNIFICYPREGLVTWTLSKLALQNENKFGTFGVWVGCFCICDGSGVKPGVLCGLHVHSTTDLHFQPYLKYLKRQEHFPSSPQG